MGEGGRATFKDTDKHCNTTAKKPAAYSCLQIIIVGVRLNISYKLWICVGFLGGGGGGVKMKKIMKQKAPQKQNMVSLCIVFVSRD